MVDQIVKKLYDVKFDCILRSVKKAIPRHEYTTFYEKINFTIWYYPSYSLLHANPTDYDSPKIILPSSIIIALGLLSRRNMFEVLPFLKRNFKNIRLEPVDFQSKITFLASSSRIIIIIRAQIYVKTSITPHLKIFDFGISRFHNV